MDEAMKVFQQLECAVRDRLASKLEDETYQLYHSLISPLETI